MMTTPSFVILLQVCPQGQVWRVQRAGGADCCTVTFSHQRAPVHHSGGSAVLFAAKSVLASLFVFSIHLVPKVTQSTLRPFHPRRRQPHRGAGKHLFVQLAKMSPAVQRPAVPPAHPSQCCLASPGGTCWAFRGTQKIIRNGKKSSKVKKCKTLVMEQ